MIPKEIYYVWLGRKPLPAKVRANIATWKQFNPDYKIIEINESNCDLDQYQFVRTAYDHRYWAFASDVIRLQTIYDHGGFYFDTDVKMLKSLDSLRTYPSVWAMENSGDVNSGLIIAAEPHDSNIKKILDIYQHRQFDPDDIYSTVTVNIVSKFFYTKGLKEKNIKQVLNDGTVILPTPYFAPYHYWNHRGHPTRKCYAVQQYLDSWGADTNFTWKTRLLADMKLYCPHILKILVSLKKRMIR